MNQTTMTRRRFSRNTLMTTAALATQATSIISPRQSRAQNSPGDRIILGLIGAGGRGSNHANAMSKLPNVEFKYVCDVNKDRGADLIKTLEKNQGRAPEKVTDMRRLLDDPQVNAVVIATPDHWHALATIWACQAGKDVYVEKSPSMTVWEGRKVIEAARKYNRIVQVGLQNRSGPYAASAKDYIQSGKLGKIVHVKVYNMLEGRKWEPKPDSEPPSGLDWDAWLGPARYVPYNAGRHLDWHPWWDYKGGALADDGIHQLDLTRMALGDPGHPKSVTCIGGNYAFRSAREAPEFQCITYDYGDFTMTCESGNATAYMRKFPNEVRYGDQWPHWPTSATRIEIYGTKALMYLGRHGCGWQVMVEGGKVLDQDKGYFPDKWHQPNFIDCLRSRKKPNADIEQSHFSACLVHLANTSYRVGQKQLLFDGGTERFTNSPEANQLQRLPYRPKYQVPETV